MAQPALCQARQPCGVGVVLVPGVDLDIPEGDDCAGGGLELGAELAPDADDGLAVVGGLVPEVPVLLGLFGVG